MPRYVYELTTEKSCFDNGHEIGHCHKVTVRFVHVQAETKDQADKIVVEEVQRRPSVGEEVSDRPIELPRRLGRPKGWGSLRVDE